MIKNLFLGETCEMPQDFGSRLLLIIGPVLIATVVLLASLGLVFLCNYLCSEHGFHPFIFVFAGMTALLSFGMVGQHSANLVKRFKVLACILGIFIYAIIVTALSFMFLYNVIP